MKDWFIIEHKISRIALTMLIEYEKNSNRIYQRKYVKYKKYFFNGKRLYQDIKLYLI